MAKLYYNGHGSFRLTSNEGKTAYIDPCCGNGYDIPADAILITHEHPDHTATDIMPHAAGMQILRPKDFQPTPGNYKSFELSNIRATATQAGFNKFHKANDCVGIIVDCDNISIYFAGDTSMTDWMKSGKLAQAALDYAILPCDGHFNMNAEVASKCAKLIAAKHSIPAHMVPMYDINDQSLLFSEKVAAKFNAPGKLVMKPGETITL